MANSGYTEEREDWLGNKYLVHFDSNGNTIGKSEYKKDWLGNEYIQHYDKDWNKKETSEFKEDWLGNEYIQHYDNEYNKTGTSEEKEDWLGNKYTQHYDKEYNKTGTSENKEDWLGNKYTQHEGRTGGGRSRYQKSLKVANMVSGTITGNNSESDQITLIIYLVIGIFILGVIFFIVMIVLFILGIALLCTPVVGLGVYFWRKEPAWLIAGLSAAVLLSFDMSFWHLTPKFLGFPTYSPLFYLYPILAGVGGFLILEPMLARFFPYNEDGAFLEQERPRQYSLGGLLALLLGLMMLIPNTGYFFPDSPKAAPSNQSVQTNPSAEANPSAEVPQQKGQQILQLAPTVKTPDEALAMIPYDQMNVWASSTLSASQQSSYSIQNIMDQKTETAWAEGAEDAGVGTTINFQFAGATPIKGIEIWNGYQKQSAKDNLYQANARLKRVLLSFSEGTELYLDLADKQQSQWFEWPPISSSKITLTIQEVYPGAKWQDLCISEIHLVQAGASGTLTIEGDGVRIRSAPNLNGTELFKLNRNAECKVLGRSANKETVPNFGTHYWYQIEHNNQQGWVFGGLTSLKE